MGEFADGLRAMNERGALFSPVKLTQKQINILSDFIKERIDEISIRYKNEGEEKDYCAALQWVKNEILKLNQKNVVPKVNLTKKRALILRTLLNENRFNDDPDFANAMQWIINKITLRWSIFGLFR